MVIFARRRLSRGEKRSDNKKSHLRALDHSLHKHANLDTNERIVHPKRTVSMVLYCCCCTALSTATPPMAALHFIVVAAVTITPTSTPHTTGSQWSLSTHPSHLGRYGASQIVQAQTIITTTSIRGFGTTRWVNIWILAPMYASSIYRFVKLIR